MANETGSSGHISREQLDQLVALFDRSEYALDPNSRDAKEAESDFNSLLDRLFQEVTQKGLSLAPTQFRAMVRQRCQAIIVSQNRKETTLPPSA